MLLKVGELAKCTGLTVRALHHYHDIGLLAPSARSASGYRLYNQADVTRLYRIQALQRLGFSLAEVGAMLASDGAPLPQLIGQQIAALDAQLAEGQALRQRLLQLQQSLADETQPELADWLTTLELMTMYDKYFTTHEAAALQQRQQQLGEDGKRALLDEARRLIAAQVPPHAPPAQDWLRRWLDRTGALVGGDERLLIKLDRMVRNEPAMQAQSGIDAAVLDYIGQATMETKLALYAKYFDAQEMAGIRAGFARHAADWPTLVGQVQRLMDEGGTPDSAPAQALAARWEAIMQNTFDVANPVMLGKLQQAMAGEPQLFANTGISPDMLAFIGQAWSASGEACS